MNSCLVFWVIVFGVYFMFVTILLTMAYNVMKHIMDEIKKVLEYRNEKNEKSDGV